VQTELFSPDPDGSQCEALALNEDSLQIWRDAFDTDCATTLMDQLLADIPWRQEYLWIGGQKRAVPRLQCWMGDRGSHYGYSGMRLRPEPWQDAVQQIRSRVESLCSQQFNSVLLNLYRDGQDSVSWHADDEAELGLWPVIASVSLGAERQFQFKPKTPASRCSHRFVLPAGSLLLMGEGIRDRWLHQLPKVKDLKEPRMILAFRRIVGSTANSEAASHPDG